jgi:Lrp/AsnC family leucine-responsive transcriptional regulator
MNLDNIDFKIIDCLKENSRMQLKEIGEIVHLSGPAVASRIAKMESLKIIKRFTIDVDQEKLENRVQSFIILYMNNSDHNGLQKFIRSYSAISEAHKISGQGCYLLKVSTRVQDELNKLLDTLSLYGTYQVNISINNIK